jgi:hypothetical protein
MTSFAPFCKCESLLPAHDRRENEVYSATKSRKLVTLKGRAPPPNIVPATYKLPVSIVTIVPSPFDPSPISRNVTIPAVISVVSFLSALNQKISFVNVSPNARDERDVP